jgi:predicted exporter
MNNTDISNRYLAIHPTTNGLGYVVLEEDTSLIKWGAYSARRDKNQNCLLMLATLINRYDPTIVVLEARDSHDRKRTERIRQFISQAKSYVRRNGIVVRSVQRRQVQKFFERQGATTKYEIALCIVEWFPELSSYLPSKRKTWESEYPHMGMFEALAIGLTVFDL